MKNPPAAVLPEGFLNSKGSKMLFRLHLSSTIMGGYSDLPEALFNVIIQKGFRVGSVQMGGGGSGEHPDHVGQAGRPCGPGSWSLS